MSATENPKTLAPQKARQGVMGKPVLIVLAVSLSLLFAVWVIVEMWGQSISPEASTPAPPAVSTKNDPTQTPTPTN